MYITDIARFSLDELHGDLWSSGLRSLEGEEGRVGGCVCVCVCVCTIDDLARWRL